VTAVRVVEGGAFEVFSLFMLSILHTYEQVASVATPTPKILLLIILAKLL
jgi:hypothetical protein